jgi:hypothetical protein
MRGGGESTPPLHFFVDGLQAAIPSVVHWIMWPRQAVVECGDYRLWQIIPVIDNPGGKKLMAHISFVAILDALQAMTACL